MTKDLDSEVEAIVREKMSRRRALSTAGKVGIGAAIAAIVAGAGGYLGGQAAIPPPTTRVETRTLTETVTAPGGVATETVTKTVSAPGTTITQTVTGAPTPVELEYTHDKGWTKWGDHSILALKPYLEFYKISLKENAFDGPDPYIGSIKPRLGTDKAPELLTWWFGWKMKELADAGYLADLSGPWSEHKDEYSEGIRNGCSVDGVPYGTPTCLLYWSMWYNKGIFNENGVKVPTTWDEFIDTCEALKKAGVQHPIGTHLGDRWPSFAWFEEIFIHTNPDLYEELMAGRASYTDSGVLEVFKIWADMIKAGYFGDTSKLLAMKWDEFLKASAERKIAMTNLWDYILTPWIEAAIPSSDIDSFQLPNTTSGLGNNVILEICTWHVGKHSKNAEKAIQVQEFWLRDTVQMGWALLRGWLFANKRIPEFLLAKQKADLLKRLKEGNYREIIRFWEATPTQIVEAGVDAFNEIYARPDEYKSIAEDLERTAKRVWAK